MNVTIVSAFRDSAGEVANFMERIYNLEWPPEHIRIICVEGDSVDDTRAQLQAWAHADPRVTVLQCDTGKPRFGSVVNPERFAVLAAVFNTGLDAVDCSWSEWVMFVPSDIRYDPFLLQRLTGHGKDLIAPFVFYQGRFYDIWAFGQNGFQFGPFLESQSANLFGAEPITMDTVGCVVLMRAELVRSGVRYRKYDVDRGLCYEAKARGFEVWADPATKVYHP